jgi:hypothetical protein
VELSNFAGVYPIRLCKHQNAGGIIEANRAGLCSLGQKVDITAIMRARIDQAVPTMGVLLQLVSIGLVAAATAILFSIASFSFLGAGPGTFTGSDTRNGGVEFNSMRYGSAPYTGGNAAFVPAETTSPKPSFEPPPGSEASASSREPLGAADGPAISAVETPRTNGSEGIADVPPRLAGETHAPVDASDRTVLAMPAAHEVRLDQPAQRDQADLLSDDKTPAQSARNEHDSGSPLSPHAAFRYRVKKECGPIINDPVLYRHCVSTFGVHYR